MRICCVIQARMGSTRLPGKIFKKLPLDSETTVLENVVKRIRKANYIDEIILAIPDTKEDEILLEEAQRLNIDCYRGELNNVLSRYYNAVKEKGFDHIVRITSDCPCVDFEVVDEVIKFHIKNDNDYTTNTLQRTYPHGLDVEIFKYNALKDAFNNAQTDFEKEHVTPFFYITNKEKYKIGSLTSKENSSDIRITLDTSKDYMLLCALFDKLYEKNEYFVLDDIVTTWQKNPWLKCINDEIVQKKVNYTNNEVLNLVNELSIKYGITHEQIKVVVEELL